MAYRLEGKLLEVCTCDVLCPCWVGADPDNGTCDGTLSWHIEKGEIQGVDVSGLTVGMLCHIPANILKGNWRVVVFLDDKASSQQEEAILKVFTGKLGGPVADFASLVGEVVGVERVAVTFEVEEGKGAELHHRPLSGRHVCRTKSAGIVGPDQGRCPDLFLRCAGRG